MSGDTLSEDKKLIWLGLRRPQLDLSEIREEIEKLKEEREFEDFQLDLDGLGSYDELETYLVEEFGFTVDEADNFIEKIQNNFETFSDFKEYSNSVESYEEMLNEFDTQVSFESDLETDDRQSIAGMRLHESSGTSYAGVSVPAGTVEIYGERIEFSRTGTPTQTSPDIQFSNLSVPTNAKLGESVQITADVTNQGDARGAFYATLLEDGVAAERRSFSLDPGASLTVSFTRSYTEDGSISITINDLEEKTLFVRRAL